MIAIANILNIIISVIIVLTLRLVLLHSYYCYNPSELDPLLQALKLHLSLSLY